MGPSGQVNVTTATFTFTATTTTLALVFEKLIEPTRVAETLVSLDGTRAPIVLTLDSSVRVLEPSYLYNVQDLKFYRSKPPLLRTALPASLADLPDGSNPFGDYHAIPVP